MLKIYEDCGCSKNSHFLFQTRLESVSLNGFAYGFLGTIAFEQPKVCGKIVLHGSKDRGLNSSCKEPEN